MAKDASRVPYLAIVALVVVVAVVVLVLNVRPSSEEAVAGEATRTLRAVSSQKLVFVSHEQINSFYGENADIAKETKSGSTICRDMGYFGCFSAEFNRDIDYYASTAGTCRGQQVVTNDAYEKDCNSVGYLGQCLNSKASNEVEPKYGDQFQAERVFSVTCLE
ncbi:MAG: hypothetical protein Q8R53_05270 [Nanoarchaeota archaeon]|nr:hypothetical protein [Nanoarchaeota archaeon]